MSHAETMKIVVGQSFEEIKKGIDILTDSTQAPLETTSLDFQEDIQRTIDQVKGAVSAALECLTRCKSADQLRGYANEAMGRLWARRS